MSIVKQLLGYKRSSALDPLNIRLYHYLCINLPLGLLVFYSVLHLRYDMIQCDTGSARFESKNDSTCLFGGIYVLPSGYVLPPPNGHAEHQSFYPYVGFILLLQYIIHRLFFQLYTAIKAYQSACFTVSQTNQPGEHLEFLRHKARHTLDVFHRKIFLVSTYLLIDFVPIVGLAVAALTLGVCFGGRFITLGAYLMDNVLFGKGNILEPVEQIFPTVANCSISNFHGSCLLKFNRANSVIFTSFWFIYVFITCCCIFAFIDKCSLICSPTSRRTRLDKLFGVKDSPLHTIFSFSEFVVLVTVKENCADNWVAKTVAHRLHDPEYINNWISLQSHAEDP